MEAGRNFENPSRFGLLRFSNSFIAHPFSRMPCEPLARRHSPLTEYRRLQKRKSRLHASNVRFECPDFLRFHPTLPLSCTFSHDNAPRCSDSASSVPQLVVPCPRNGWHAPRVPRIRVAMSASGFALALAMLLALSSPGPGLVFAQPAVPSSPLPSVPAPVTPRREVRIGVAGVPATLDPMAALEGPGPLVLRQVLDTLVAYRETSTDIEPALATRWTVSRDGLVWSFTLRDGARFHDGTPLTAKEAAASFERWRDADGGRAASSMVVWNALLRGVPGIVKEVRAADARTLQFVLAQPYAPLLTVLAHPGFGITKTAPGADGSSVLVGSGPYRVAEGRPGRLVLEAVAGHWSGGARAERLVFQEVGSDDQAETDMDARAVDVWFPPGPPRRTDGALSIPGLHVGFLAFQTEKEPFSRKKIRQAIAAAIDPPVLGLALGRAAVPLLSFLPPGVWARRDGPPLLGGTREAVAVLLREGGWAQSKATLLVSAEPA